MSVTPADVATTLGRSAPSNGSATYKQWSLWIADARRIIAAKLGDLAQLDQDNLDYVVREAVAAHVRNTRRDGATSKSVTTDDSTVTNRWENGTGPEIDILDSWWDLLNPDVDGSDSWNIRPYPVRPSCRPGW